MIVYTQNDLDKLKEPMGAPDGCGISEEHHRVSVHRTPARWCVQRWHHWQGQTGIWWACRDRRRYVATEDQATALADDWTE